MQKDSLYHIRLGSKSIDNPLFYRILRSVEDDPPMLALFRLQSVLDKTTSPDRIRGIKAVISFLQETTNGG